MGEQNGYSVENTLDFAVLNALRYETLDSSAIERRIQRVRAILDFAAARKGALGPASTETALERLRKAGWLETSRPQGVPGSETQYALTSEGRKQLELEQTRRESSLASFVEDGALDGSFRRFLSESANQEDA